tara:strand:+ start:1021 stop:1584 length:564 start_codon:yes stop_codon:yes gene_type:complete
MKHIFSNSFYLLFSLPNKKEVFESVTNSKYVNKELTSRIKWNENCRVEVEELYADKVGHLLVPSIELFLEHIGAKKSVSLLSIWKNTYNKDGFQEIHDHVNKEAQLSGCIFLEDQTKDTSRFYFYNRHNTELVIWKEIMNDQTLNNSWSPNIKAGDIIFFPSYMLHGVTPHKLRKPRTTISFNLKFI